MSQPSRRLLHVDALKAVAAQAIVLHHLLSYGPMARAAHEALPLLAGWAHQYGRMAVQVFLVIGGFLSARALSPRGQALAGNLPELLWKRYLRLTLPFLAATGLTVLAYTLVRPLLPELVPQGVSLTQWLAHATLTHELLGIEALTVGAWYVAIDFQLFALLLALLWLARRLVAHPARLMVGPILVGVMVGLSAFGFNRLPGLDATALYFFAAYGLGAAVHWLGLWKRGRLGLALLTAALLAALALEWRERLALALATALLLAWAHARHARGQALPLSERIWARASLHSYALFLIHYPVLLLINAALVLADAGLGACLMSLLGCWLLANALAAPFHRWVEAPAARLDPRAWVPQVFTRTSRS